MAEVFIIDECKVLCNIVDSEIETMKSVFHTCIKQFYDEYDSRVSLRREKVCKYISLLTKLIDETKNICEVVKNE